MPVRIISRRHFHTVHHRDFYGIFSSRRPVQVKGGEQHRIAERVIQSNTAAQFEVRFQMIDENHSHTAQNVLEPDFGKLSARHINAASDGGEHRPSVIQRP